MKRSSTQEVLVGLVVLGCLAGNSGRGADWRHSCGQRGDHRPASDFHRRLWCLVRALLQQVPDGGILGGSDRALRSGLCLVRVPSLSRTQSILLCSGALTPLLGHRCRTDRKEIDDGSNARGLVGR